MLDTVTYRNEEVIKLAEKFISVKVNGKVDTVLSRTFGIAGYPTVVLTRADGSEIDRVFGYQPPEEFIQTINDYLVDKNTLADYLRKADTTVSLPLYATIADKYTGRSMYDKAEEYYRKILQEDPANKQGYSDSALYNLGQMKTRAKDYTGALEILDKLPATYPESDLADDAVYYRGITLRRADRFDDAIAALTAFMEKYPSSDLIADAEIYIAYCYGLKKDYPQAISRFEKFLVDHPDHGDSTWAKEQIVELKKKMEGSSE